MERLGHNIRPNINNKMNSIERYSRQLTIPEIGETGQKQLKNAKVLIIGAGGLGSPVAMYLAAAGIGTLGLIDNDTVSISNLNRQILYTERDLGKLKTLVAKNRIEELNGDIQVNTYTERITDKNILEIHNIISQYDIVVDTCDNMTTRYIVSDIAEKLEIPYVYGAIEGFCGYISLFYDKSNYKRFRDLWPEENQQFTHEIPAIGATAGVIGSLQANLVIKYICGFGERLAGKLLTIDLYTMEFHTLLF